MPMISVCPGKPDYNALVMNYIDKHYDREKDPELYDYVRGAAIYMKMRTDYAKEKLARGRDVSQSILDACQTQRNDSSGGCEVIGWLFAGNLVEAKGNATGVVNCEDHDTSDLLKTYLFVESLVGGGLQPTNEGFKTFVEGIKKGCTLPNNVDLPDTPNWLTSDPVDLYSSLLHPGIWRGGTKEHKMKGLESMELGKMAKAAEDDLKVKGYVDQPAPISPGFCKIFFLRRIPNAY